MPAPCFVPSKPAVIYSRKPKIHPHSALTAIFTAALLLWASCGNFFSSDEIQLDPRTIRGTVHLSQSNDLAKIFIYLDGINIGTFTDANGMFQLTLPPNLGAAGGSVSGVFDLYFYVANYNLKKVRVAIQNGQFVFGQEGLDQNGKITPTPMLSRAVRIEVIPTSGYEGVASRYAAKIRITAEGDPVPVDLPNASPQMIGGALLQNLDTDSVFIKRMYTSGYAQIYHFTAYQSGCDFSFIFDSKDLNLPAGRYRIVPHVLPNYDALAKKIANCMDMEPTVLTKDYLKWPIRFIDGEVTIKEEKPPPPE